MKSLRTFLSPLVLALVPAMLGHACGARAAQTAYIILGPSASCGEWTEYRSRGAIGEVPTASWVLGYLSGRAISSIGDPLKNTDVPSVLLWIDNYCKANPLNKTPDAADALIQELAHKAANRR